MTNLNGEQKIDFSAPIIFKDTDKNTNGDVNGRILRDKDATVIGGTGAFWVECECGNTVIAKEDIYKCTQCNKEVFVNYDA